MNCNALKNLNCKRSEGKHWNLESKISVHSMWCTIETASRWMWLRSLLQFHDSHSIPAEVLGWRGWFCPNHIVRATDALSTINLLAFQNSGALWMQQSQHVISYGLRMTASYPVSCMIWLASPSLHLNIQREWNSERDYRAKVKDLIKYCKSQ